MHDSECCVLRHCIEVSPSRIIKAPQACVNDGNHSKMLSDSGSFLHPGDCFLVVTGSAKIKIYDRDGRELGESLQGDMYIRDMKNTKGHVSPCLNGQWHPHNK